MTEKMTKTEKKNRKLIRTEIRQAFGEVKNTFASSTSFIISALTLVSGLAWNDFAKTLFSNLKQKISGWGETIGLLIYAVVVTLIAVIAIRRLKKIQNAIGGKSIK